MSGRIYNQKKLDEKYLYSGERKNGDKFYLAKVTTQVDTPGIKKSFPLTPAGKAEALKAIETQVNKIKKISKETGFRFESIRKLKEPPNPNRPWIYARSGSGAKKINTYYATEAQAKEAQAKALENKYSAQKRPITKEEIKLFQKEADRGFDKKTISKNLGASLKRVERSIADGDVKYTPYLENKEHIKFVKDNYGVLKKENIAKKIYPNLPLSQALSRTTRLTSDLFDSGELTERKSAGQNLQNIKEKGYNKETKTKLQEIVKENKNRRIDTVSSKSGEASIRKGLGKFSGTDRAHRASLKQAERFGLKYKVRNIGVESEEANRKIIRPIEARLGKLYDDQFKYYEQIKDLDNVPLELQKEISTLNNKINELTDITGGRLQPIFLDEKTGAGKFGPINEKYSAAFGIVDENVEDIALSEQYEGNKKITPENRLILDANLKEQNKFELANVDKDMAAIEALYSEEDIEFRKKLDDTFNEAAGRKICREGCFIKVAKNNPGLFKKAIQLLTSRGGKIGTLVAGATAVGAGVLSSDVEAEELEKEIDPMDYNSVTGKFVKPDGEPVSQAGKLNWIADNPIKTGAALTGGFMGLGYGIRNLAPKGAKYLMGWQAGIPAFGVPYEASRFREGMDVGEMATDPWNALYAAGIGGQAAKDAFYKNRNELGLKNITSKEGLKKLPNALKNAIMSPRATGTKATFGLPSGLEGSRAFLSKVNKAKGIGGLALRGLGMARMVGGMALATTPIGWGTAALFGANELYKSYKKGASLDDKIDDMRLNGKITEQDADTYKEIVGQGWLSRTVFGQDDKMLEGRTIGADEQDTIRQTLNEDIYQGQIKPQEMEDRAYDRSGVFQLFNNGGRVGFNKGGPNMSRRAFLKLMSLFGIGLAGASAGMFKTVGKQAVKKGLAEVATSPVEGMPSWFPRVVAKIQADGKLKTMADRQYVTGDKYEHTIEGIKFELENNPVSGEITLNWDGQGQYGEIPRTIYYKPGKQGYQKMNTDPEFPNQSEDMAVEVEEPSFDYIEPDYSSMGPDGTRPEDANYLDIFTEGDNGVAALENYAKQDLDMAIRQGGDKAVRKLKKDTFDKFKMHTEAGPEYYNFDSSAEKYVNPQPIDESDVAGEILEGSSKLDPDKYKKGGIVSIL